MIFGPGTLDNDNAVDEFGAILYLIAARVDQTLSEIENLKTAETSVMTGITALRILVEAFPGQRHIILRRDRVERWRDQYFSWLDRAESRIPKKFREGVRESSSKEFELLLEKV